MVYFVSEQKQHPGLVIANPKDLIYLGLHRIMLVAGTFDHCDDLFRCKDQLLTKLISRDAQLCAFAESTRSLGNMRQGAG